MCIRDRYISATVQQALQDANMAIADVDAVAVTFAPGLIGAVLVGNRRRHDVETSGSI